MSKEEALLIQKLKSNDSEAIEDVVRQNISHLYKACLGLGFSDLEAEDITQATWMTFFDVLKQFESRSTIRTFLFGILYNKASEFRKKNKKIEATENIEDVLDSYFDLHGHWIMSNSPVSPERFIEGCQTLNIISKCLDFLSLNQKMAFLLKEVEEEITEEICNILNVTNTHLGVLLFRAKNQLRDCIDKKVSR